MCRENRTWIVIFLFVLLAGLIASACGSSEESEGVAPTASPSGEVEVEQLELLTVPGDDWGYPSPFSFYPRGPGYIAMHLIFDTLTWKDESGVIPWLADSWSTSDDGRAWTFELHEGVKWQDGEPLTAEDVKFSFEYGKAHVAVSSWFAALEDVESVEVSGDHEVVVHLTRPSASFQDDIAGNMPVIPKHIWEDVEDPAKFTTEEAVVGSGPFKLASYSKEEGTYVYDANNDFFAGRPLVKRLVMTRVSDEALALETGTVDEASFWGKEIDVLGEFEEDERFQVISGPSFWVLQVIFNNEKPPTNLVEFRKAVAHAIDREEIIEKVTHGGAIVAHSGILHPDSDWYSPDVAAYDYDPEEAERLLDFLDFVDRDGDGVRETPEGEKLSFVLVTTSDYGSDYSRESEIIKENLGAVGIDVEVKALDYSTADGILREGNFQLAITGLGGISAPSILDQPDWPANTYQNEEYSALYQRQSEETDVKERAELVAQLQAMVADDLPVFTLYHPKMWCVFNPDKLDTWFYTKNGVAVGIPIEMNKLIFVER
jgi:peptide/nickel transport system substrate-binding protein